MAFVTVNIPNFITVFRLVLTAIFIAATTFNAAWAYHTALITFTVAAISDWADGYLARKLNRVTTLGKLLDPLADKILVAAGFIYLSIHPAINCPVWITCLIIGREFMVTGLRQIAVEQGKVIAADNLGKWKTTFQLVSVIGSLTHISFATFDESNSVMASFSWIVDPNHFIILTTLWIATALTLISGFNYIYRNRELLQH